MSYFPSVRRPDSPLGLVPGLAVNQDFKVFTHIFYYGPLTKPDWSFVRGDVAPF